MYIHRRDFNQILKKKNLFFVLFVVLFLLSVFCLLFFVYGNENLRVLPNLKNVVEANNSLKGKKK